MYLLYIMRSFVVKQMTSYEVRIRDWSADVCSSDLKVGIGAPEIEYSVEPDGDWVDSTTVHKGGLFGTDYRMLFPGDGIDGIKRFFLDVMLEFGRRGLACQPAIVGIGLGGSKDTAMSIGKQAACLRTVGDRNPDPEIARSEEHTSELQSLMRISYAVFCLKT